MPGDPGKVGRIVCQILQRIYVRSRARFEHEARKRGITLEQLAAAAIAMAVMQQQKE